MTIKLMGSSSGSVALDAPASTTGAANLEFKLPVADGSDGQYIKTDGSGNLAFATVASPKIKEQFYSPCDGSAIALNQGSTTLGDVTAEHTPATSFADVPGSTLAYVPPSGTTQVIYEFNFT